METGLTHCLDRHDDPQPGIGGVIVGALFQDPDHFARFRHRLVAMAIEMEMRGAQNIELRNYHDRTVTKFRW